MSQRMSYMDIGEKIMNNNFIDETGKTYGRLTVLQKTEKRN